ncbi:MAG: 4Fe-4S dicluster domain-containing protein [Myxococcales bacterium]|nr:4Fe-4S dicluster domain-containing protein [Myxococcota bacterium]MDW8283691.1 4Fe-4S dicluster domain-containing protein [Myxococcales bacterium]
MAEVGQPPPRMLTEDGLEALVGALLRRGYRVIGPTVREGAIVLDEISSAAELPVGWTAEQEAGSYRLRRRADRARFGWAVGPHSAKRLLFPPSERLLSVRRSRGGLVVHGGVAQMPPQALLGARPCDLAAIAVQDRVLLGGAWADPAYQARRERLFVVAVNCGEAGGTCFCVSMGTGPAATAGFDLVLTELIDPDRGQPSYLIRAGTPAGQEVLAELAGRAATPAEVEAAAEVVARTAQSMGRRLDTAGLHQVLTGQPEHPRWQEVATRCLTCANCTLVCPTCFCHTVEDTSDLSGEHAERWRRWDSCFTLDFSYVHGGSVRPSVRARYRQWLTHKLATWIDQFGTSGCVGCGRCITWCPVGIDITEEVRALRGPGGSA